MTSKYTVQVNARPQIVVNDGDPDTLLLNLDPTDTIYLVDERGMDATQAQSIPLEPLGSAIVSGEGGATWAVTATGQTANIAIAPFFKGLTVSPSVIAQQILSSGISLLANPVKLYDTTASLAGSGGGAIQQMTPITTTTVNGLVGTQANEISYELEFSCTIASTTEATPLLFVAVDFYELASDTVPVDTINWVIAAGNTVHKTQGRGPMRGQFIVVTVSNLTGSNSTIVINSFKMYGVGRNVSRDDWRDINSGNLTTGTGGLKAMTSNMQTNLVGLNSLLVVNAGQNNVRLAALWSGLVIADIVVSGLTTNQLQIQLIAASTGEQLENAFIGAAGNTALHQQYAFPREPVLVTYTNNSGVAATITASYVAVEP